MCLGRDERQKREQKKGTLWHLFRTPPGEELFLSVSLEVMQWVRFAASAGWHWLCMLDGRVETVCLVFLGIRTERICVRNGLYILYVSSFRLSALSLQSKYAK